MAQTDWALLTTASVGFRLQQAVCTDIIRAHRPLCRYVPALACSLSSQGCGKGPCPACAIVQPHSLFRFDQCHGHCPGFSALHLRGLALLLPCLTLIDSRSGMTIPRLQALTPVQAVSKLHQHSLLQHSCCTSKMCCGVL
jgi:hypothetical protein